MNRHPTFDGPENADGVVARIDGLERDETAARLVDAARDRGGEILEAHGPTVEASFETPLAALRYAVFARDLPENLSIGLHAGCLPEGAPTASFDLPLRNTAAAVTDMAAPDQLLMTHRFLEVLDASGATAFQENVRDLGRHTIQVGTPPVRLHELEAAASPPERLPARFGRADLPEHASPFVGRNPAGSDLDRSLDRHPVVTITGPPGIGKTRLAVEYARRWWRSDRGRETHYVDLRGAETLEEVVATIGASLVVPFDPRGAGDEHLVTLGGALAARDSTLLILDLPETAESGVAVALQTLLPMAPAANWIAVSRRALHLVPEYEIALGALQPAAAIELFEHHRRAAGAEPLEGGNDIRETRRIVELLGGHPQSIRLAARRAAVERPGRLAERLAQQMGSSAEDPVEPGRFVRAVVGDLHDETRTVLEQLQTTPPGTRLSAAIEATTIPTTRAIERVRTLLRTGLVEVVRRPPSEGRFYATVRGLERRGDGSTDEVPSPRFAEHLSKTYSEIGANLFDALRREDPIQTLDELHLQRAPLRRAIELGPEDSPQARQTIRLLGDWYRIRGPIFEGRDWLGELVRQTAESAPLLSAEASLALARLELVSGDVRDAESRLEQLEPPDPDLRARVALERLAAARSDGDPLEQRRTLADRTKRVAEEGAEAETVARIHLEEGHLALDEEELEHARSTRREARRLAEDSNSVELLAQTASLRARIERESYRFEEARRSLRTVTSTYHNLRCSREHLRALLRLAATERRLERTETARRTFERALRVARRSGEMKSGARVLRRLGHLEAIELEFERGRRHFRKALEITEDVVWPEIRGPLRAYVAATEAALGRNDAARQSLRRARTQIENLEGKKWEEVLRLIGHVSEVAAVDHGLEAPAVLRPSQRAVAEIAGRTNSPEVLDALRLLDTYLARVEHGARHTSEESTRPTRPTLLLGPDAEWFRSPGHDRIDLSRRGARRRLFGRLVRHRRQFPGRPLGIDRLADAGWPEESLGEDTARNRVYQAVSTLRDLGLREILTTHGTGYRLDPHVAILTESTDP